MGFEACAAYVQRARLTPAHWSPMPQRITSQRGALSIQLPHIGPKINWQEGTRRVPGGYEEGTRRAPGIDTEGMRQ